MDIVRKQRKSQKRFCHSTGNNTYKPNTIVTPEYCQHHKTKSHNADECRHVNKQFGRNCTNKLYIINKKDTPIKRIELECEQLLEHQKFIKSKDNIKILFQNN